MIRDKAVAAAFSAYSDEVRQILLALRDLILDVAASDPDTGPLEETLKWGQPAYLAKGGSTLRLGQLGGDAALFVHCQTTILGDFQSLFPQDFRYEGRRAIVFSPAADLLQEKLRLIIRHALTYHRRPGAVKRS